MLTYSTWMFAEDILEADLLQNQPEVEPFFWYLSLSRGGEVLISLTL